MGLDLYLSNCIGIGIFNHIQCCSLIQKAALKSLFINISDLNLCFAPDDEETPPLGFATPSDGLFPLSGVVTDESPDVDGALAFCPITSRL